MFVQVHAVFYKEDLFGTDLQKASIKANEYDEQAQMLKAELLDLFYNEIQTTNEKQQRKDNKRQRDALQLAAKNQGGMSWHKGVEVTNSELGTKT